MLNGVLLPAMMLVPANPALAFEAWDALRLFPYQRRFRFYHALQARQRLCCADVTSYNGAKHTGCLIRS